MATYSFLDVSAAIVGPGGAFQLGNGAGAAEEGIDIEPMAEKETMTIGADGVPMHSLHADKSGTVTVRLLKTSPVNAQLNAMYNLQQLSAAVWGNNVITLTNSVTGESITCRSVAFKKKPKMAYAKDGGTNEWQFNAGFVDSTLGTY